MSLDGRTAAPIPADAQRTWGKGVYSTHTVDRIAVELLTHRTLGPEELDTLDEIFKGGATEQDWQKLREVLERRKTHRP